MSNTRKGWIFALITAVLWAVSAIYLKSMSSYVDNVNGLVVVLESMIAGSFLLLILAGAGRLSLDTIKNGYTWSFGSLQILSNICTFAALSVTLTATSLTLLTRFSIILSVIIAVFVDQKVKVSSKLGFSLICLGLIIVSISLSPEYRYIALFWVFLVCLAKVVRSRVAQSHKQNNKATGDFKAEMRVTGYILAITSLMYALILFITMNLGFNEFMPQVIPSKEEFFALKPFALAVFVGALIMASMRYTELVSTKHIGGTNFLTVMAFVPLLTYPAQYILAVFTSIPSPKTNSYEMLGGLLIISGALLLANKAVNSSKKKPKKLAPRASKDLHIVRDTIRTTKICFNDDLEKTAKSLGIAESTLDKIMRYDKPITKTMKERIIDNYSKNIAGLDHLTGANNKTSCDIELQKLSGVDQALILFIDLNKFKPVNDTYGHKAGDMVLKGISERLMAMFKEPDFVARLGGDEYCVIIKGAKATDLEKYVKNVKDSVSELFVIPDSGVEIEVGCSIGGSHYPTEGDCGLKLKEVADKRMYEDKKVNGAGR